MIRYGMLLLIFCMFGSVCADTSLLKLELDRVIDEKVLLWEHHDDAQASIDALKTKGHTNYTIVESMSRCLRRDLNFTNEDIGGYKANMAIYWIGELGDQNQISNLLYVAQVSTNNVLAAAAIQSYHRRINDKGRFLDEALPLLERSSKLKTAIWWCLEEDASGPMRERIVSAASEKLKAGFENLYYADRILSKWKIGYADSPERKRLIAAAAEDPVVEKEFPRVRKCLLERLDKGVVK